MYLTVGKLVVYSEDTLIFVMGQKDPLQLYSGGLLVWLFEALLIFWV